MKRSTIYVCGVIIALGAVIWSLGWLRAGVRPIGPDGNPINDQVEIWAGGVFQIGLVALLFIMLATRATGANRLGRWVLNAEIVALALAIAWTIPFLFDANRPHNVILLVLDAFWPLSILGLIAVGVLVIRARRWPVPVRYLPLAASLIIPVDIFLMVTGVDEWTQIVLRSAYLAVTYTLLGVAIILQVAPLMGSTTDSRDTQLEPTSV
ncbi:hypothetical protein BH23CHL2_BH23CHL2_11910 [soil metagenome]